MRVSLLGAIAAGCTGSIHDPAVGNAGAPGSGGYGESQGRSSEGSSTDRSGNSSGSPSGTLAPGVTTGDVDPARGAPAGAFATVAAGPAPLRRLTSVQYGNTVRDLLRLPAAPSTKIAGDEGEAGYAANASVSIKDLQAEQYRDAAEALAAAAARNPGALIPCAQSPGVGEPDCASELISRFGKRAFRRPLDPTEIQRYRDLFARVRGGATFAAALGAIVEAMLQSPHFLYRVELGAGPSDPSGSVALSAYEVASRLSYFLWGSMPDDMLFAAADAGRLRTAEDIAAQVTRMLKHASARDGIWSFHEQWLRLGELSSLEKDSMAFPTFTAELRAAMREEVQRFVDGVLRGGDGLLASLLTSGASHLSGPLFALYGLPAAGTKDWQSTVFPAGQRAGLLTLAGVMATHAHPAQSSLVLRGVLIRENFLCTKLPDPPPGVDDNPPAVSPTATARQRFAAHRKDPSCGGCHGLIDALGEPFEVYDGIGRFRTKEGTSPIDASGVLTGTAANDGPVKGPTELAAKLASADEVRQCIARQWFRYAFGREESEADMPALGQMFETFRRSSFRVNDLLVAIATAKTFTHRNAVRPQ